MQCELGNAISFIYDGETLFQGYVFERQKHSESSIINITCYDKGIYLKRNQKTYKIKEMTPEAITKKICQDFGIEIGSIAQTNIKISRNFIGSNLYQIIQTAYILASEQNGKKYLTYFLGSKLMVIEKKVNENTIIVTGGSNLMSASTSESIANIINQVAIYDSKDKLVSIQKNQDSINSYGLFQSYLKKEKNQDVTKKAKKLMDDNGVTQKITIENLGNVANITGNTIVVKEPYTGVYGTFFIDNDIHTWKNGQYYNKLIINFRNIMDEQAAGTLMDKKKKSDGGKWEYLYEPGGTQDGR